MKAIVTGMIASYPVGGVVWDYGQYALGLERLGFEVFYLEDTGWHHFRNYPRWDANPKWYGTHGYRAHDFFFTYAGLTGSADCALPSLGLPWQPTRPPVVMDCWQAELPNKKWTTVMTWKNFRET